MIKLKILKDKTAVAKEASKHYLDLFSQKEDAVLGLATGSTPLPLYEELIELYKNKQLSFSKTRSFNLDEYCHLPISHEQSYHAFMHKHFFEHVDIPSDQIHIPNGNADNLEAECLVYNAQLSKYGPIDLQLLGIGRNGHVGFNEPNAELEIATHIVALKEETVLDNSRFFNKEEEVPRYAISVGMKSILTARKILVLAVGQNKAEIVKALMSSGITTSIPASLLHVHHDVTLLCDESAASLL